MAFDFPNSPTTGQIATGPGGIQWQYDGVKWTVINSASPGVAPINNPIFTGDPQAPTAPYGDNDQSLSNTSFVQSAVTPLTHNVGRNFFHNPTFRISQRGNGPFTAFAGYTLDRWILSGSTDTANVSAFQLADADRAAIGDEWALWALQNAFVGNAATAAFNAVAQWIEKTPRLSGKTVTVSFWAVRTAGTVAQIGVSYIQSFGTGGSPYVYGNGTAVTISTTWARYSVTLSIPSAAGKTLGINNDDCTAIRFWCSSGANNNALAGGIGVQSGTVQFWGMQLEIGPTATPLEKLDPRLDLANCQRFYQGSTGLLTAGGYAGAAFQVGSSLPVQMRAAPTCIIVNNNSINVTGNNINAPSANYVFMGATVTATGNATINVNFTASADL